MLSKYQRRKREREKNNLEQQHELQSSRIANIRRKLIIETDEAVRFKYEQQIQDGERELESIDIQLNKIEEQIENDNRLREPRIPQVTESAREESKHKFFRWLPLLLLLSSALGGIGLWIFSQSMKPSILDLCREDYPLISCKSSNSTIDKNNKEILSKIGKTLNKDRVHIIAVVVPGGNARTFISQDMLDGVAKKQDQFNNAHVDRKIFVVIAHEAENSKGEPDGGLKIAKKLVEQKLILGVVGPYSSSSLAHVVNTYCKNNLVVVSPTATTPTNDLTKMIILNHLEPDLKSEKDIRLECFFRIPETHDKAVEVLVDYLVKKQYKRVLILGIDGDAAAISSAKYLIDKIKKTEIDLDEKDKRQLNVSNSNIEIKKIIEKWKEKYKSQIEKTAILLIEGGKYSNLDDTLGVIQANDGHFTILGNNSVFDPKLLDKLNNKRGAIMKDSIKKIVIAAPSLTLKSGKGSRWYESSNLTWYESMSSYATQILINSIDKEFEKSGSVERAGVGSQFNENNFDIKADTKIIKLRGGDLQNISYDLIRPNCSNGTCKWEKINLDDKPRPKSAP